MGRKQMEDYKDSSKIKGSKGRQRTRGKGRIKCIEA